MVTGGQDVHTGMVSRIVMAWVFTLPPPFVISGTLSTRSRTRIFDVWAGEFCQADMLKPFWWHVYFIREATEKL